MIGAIIVGTFFAVALIIVLVLVFFIKSLSIKCVHMAYETYLSEKGYEKPSEKEIKECYEKAVQAIGKKYS